MRQKEKPYTTDDLNDGHLIVLRAMVAYEATIHYSRDGDLAWLSAADGRRFPVLPPEATLQPLRETRMLSYDPDDEDGNDSNTTRITDAGRAYVAAREGQGVGRQYLAIDIACRPKPPLPPKRADDVARAAESLGPKRRDEGAAKAAIQSVLAAQGTGRSTGALDELSKLVAMGEPYGHGPQAAIDKAEWLLRIVSLSAALGAKDEGRRSEPAGPNLEERRGERADEAFEAYEFSDYITTATSGWTREYVVTDTSGWEWDAGSDRYDRTIWFANGEGDDSKGSFTVIFEPGSDTVSDAYATCNGEDVGRRPKA